MLVRDQEDEPAAVKIENVSISREHSLVIKMRRRRICGEVQSCGFSGGKPPFLT